VADGTVASDVAVGKKFSARRIEAGGFGDGCPSG
jgi:hypothetical protein